MNTAIKKAIALAFVTFLVVVSASVIFADDGEADRGKYLLNVEITKGFNDLDGGTITVTFQEQEDGEHTLNVQVKSANRTNIITEKDVVLPKKTDDGKYKESFSFKVGDGETVYVVAYENGQNTGEITITIPVEKTIWTNPLVWIVIVIVIIALVVFGIMRYRHVVDKKKNNSKEKIFTKMEEERKQKKLNK